MERHGLYMISNLGHRTFKVIVSLHGAFNAAS
jgi:hypothetical protein